jgi:hypothetical protein
MQDGLVAGGSDSSETLAQRASSHKKAVKRYGGHAHYLSDKSLADGSVFKNLIPVPLDM